MEFYGLLSFVSCVYDILITITLKMSQSIHIKNSVPLKNDDLSQ